MKQKLDVIVVGAGPTGIAALNRCQKYGLKALALEEGCVPLAAIEAYNEGLVLSSPASHFQIDGLPLDCKDLNHLTREEVLFYYSRVINLKKLNIECNKRVVSFHPTRESVTVTYAGSQGKETLEARHVIISAWFRRAQLRIPHLQLGPAKIVGTPRNTVGLSNKSVVIVGSGLSACETAITLMLSGQSVTVLLRGSRHALHLETQFADLVKATNSKVIEHVQRIEGHVRGLTLTTRKGKLVVICDIVIPCIGQRTDTAMLKALHDAKIISGNLRQRLETLIPADKQFRKSCKPVDTAHLDQVVDAWPDLSEFFPGKKNVHFAGGILHVGSSSAGVKVSIHSARTIVDIIAKKQNKLPDKPLPRTLYVWSLTADDEVAFTSIQNLRPRPVWSWSRHHIPLTAENQFGRSNLKNPKAFYTGKEYTREEAEVLALSNGKRTIRKIIEQCAKKDLDPAVTVRALYSLFYSNVLTWLP